MIDMPLMLHVSKCLRATLRDLYLNQDVFPHDRDQAIADRPSTLKYFDLAFEDMRGFEIHIDYKNRKIDDGNGDEHEPFGRAGAFITIGVGYQADVHLMLSLTEEGLERLRNALRRTMRLLEVVDNGVSGSVLDRMTIPGDIDNVAIYSGCVMYGHPAPPDADGFQSEYREELDSSVLLDEQGNPCPVRLII